VVDKGLLLETRRPYESSDSLAEDERGHWPFSCARALIDISVCRPRQGFVGSH